MKLKNVAKDLLPPLVLRAAQVGRRIRISGKFETWSEASARSSGYNSENVLHRVVEAARMVRDGKAAYERDGVPFSVSEPVWPLLSALLRHAVRHEGDLNVLDFGGSLGSLYFQLRPYLPQLRKLTWSIVEQEMFVQVGQKEFSTDVLTFHRSMDSVPSTGQATLALVSAVVPWIEHPHALLDDVTMRGYSTIVLDRTAMTEKPTDELRLQHVPRSIYSATYPIWALSHRGVVRHFEKHYTKVFELPDRDPPIGDIRFRGMVFEKTS